MTESNVVDTNVLEHVFEPTINANRHIDRLLEKFVAQKRILCIDSPPEKTKSRIIAEYNNRLKERLKTMDEQDQRVIWLRYLLLYADRRTIAVDLSDQLGYQIVPHMDKVGAERSDQVFVYVACALDCVMISNNKNHITNLRAKLRKAARKHGSDNTDFLSSTDAEAGM